MALNIPIKLPHPIAEALMEKYGEDFFLKATELNDIVAAIKTLELEDPPDMEWEIDDWT